MRTWGVLVLTLLVGLWVRAAPYPPDGEPITWTQRDGTVLQLRVLGDDLYAVTQTVDGFTVLYDSASGNYVFAEKDAATGDLKPGKVPAHRPPPAGLAPRLRESQVKARAKREAMAEIYDKERAKAFEARLRARRMKKAQATGQAAAPDDAQAMASYSAAQVESFASPVSGARVGLTILVQFPDDPATAAVDPVNFPTTQAKVQRYCNEVGYTDDGNTGSVRDYFYDQSEGKLTFTHVVTAVVTLPHPRNKYNFANYPTNTTLPSSGTVGRAILTDAITILKNQGFDFSSLSVNGSNQVISTSVLFAGNSSGQWSYGLWPHAWSLTSPGINVGTTAAPRYIYRYQITNAESASIPIGTFCHELGHLLLDYPDLYDTDASDGDSAGVGQHCLMGSGNHLNGGKTPGPIGLYLKDFSGWATLTDITPTTNADVVFNTTGARGHRIRKPGTTTEFFLVENRGSGDKWASSSPDKGILIWHVDEAVTTGNKRQQMTASQHYFISVEQADGWFDLENNNNRGDSGDLFDLSDGLFDDTTTPSAKWWAGTSSGVRINALSNPASRMLVRFGTSARPGITSPLTASSTLALPFSYQITATLSPTSFGATGLPAGLSVNTATGLISGTPSQAGTFSVTLSATNGSGASTVPMTLTVIAPKLSLFDDFDPALDAVQWAELGASLAANTNAVAGPGNYGKSLWFGGDGTRSATTVAIDVNEGGNVHFKFAASNGSAYPWEKIDAGEGLVLEYSTDGTNFTYLAGPYTNTTWQSYTVAIPSAAMTRATQFRFRQLSHNGASFDHCAIDDVFIGQGNPPVPVLTLEQPAGTPLDHGGTASYGYVTAALPKTLTFAIKNTGTTDLLGLSAALSGSQAADFAITTTPAASLAPGASTSMSIRFTPGGVGARSASLVLASNDLSRPAYTVTLSGMGYVPAASIQDDFDPDVDPSVWSSLTGGAEANTYGQQGGPGSVGKSLWFGGSGTRSAVTVAVNTTGGGNVIFRLAQANGSFEPWEKPETGEGIVVEYSTNGTTFTQMGSTYTNNTWQVIGIPIPAAAMTTATLFRIRQLSHSGASFDHWAIDNVHIGTGAIIAPEIEVEQPAGNPLVDGFSTVQVGNMVVGAPNLLTFTVRNVGTAVLSSISTSLAGTHPGDFTVTTAPATSVSPLYSTTFVLRFQPTAAGTRSAILRIASNDADENPFDINLSGIATAALTGLDFAILSLGPDATATVDHAPLTGFSYSGVAASGSTAFVTGGSSTGVYPATLDSSGVSTLRMDGLCSDVGTGEIYTLAHNNIRISPTSTQASQLQRLNPADGATTTTFIPLSQPIPLANGSGIFSGYGRILIHNGTAVYEIRTPSGTVTHLGNMAVPEWSYTSGWAVWGAAEFFGGRHYLCFRDEYNNVIRSRVPDGREEIISSFPNVGFLPHFTVSPKLGSWFFQGALTRNTDYIGTIWLGRAAATFSAGNATAPAIMSTGRVAFVRYAASSYQVVATASPSSYSATGIPPGMTFNSTTGLLSGVPNTAGAFHVQFNASNGSGMGSKTVAVTVYEPATTYFEDFDPGLDTALWYDVRGTPTTNTIGQRAGSGSTGNSLYFNSSGQRSVTTRPIDTSNGGVFSFKFAAAGYVETGWNNFVRDHAVVLEYSINGQDFLPLGGPYYNRAWQTISISIPPAARSSTTFFRFRQPRHYGTDSSQWALDDVRFDPTAAPTADLAIENMDGYPWRHDDRFQGELYHWDRVPLGQEMNDTFVIRNYGAATLYAITGSIGGTHSDDFVVTGLPASLAPGASAEFEVRFSPTAHGLRRAELRIASSDADISLYRIHLSGRGIDPTPVGPARITYQQDQPRLVFEVGEPPHGTLWVEAAGSPTIKYQWFRNGAALGGTNGPELLMQRAAFAHAGRYHCRVSNVIGGRARSDLSLPVEVIVANTRGHVMSVKVGDSATLPCLVAGNGLRYEWYKGQTRLTGATGRTLATGPLPGPQSYDFTCNVYVGQDHVCSIPYYVSVHELKPLLADLTFLQPGKVGTPYLHQMEYNDDVARTPSKWTAIGLPPGVTITSTGLIQGTPRVSKMYNPTITASNSAGSSSITLPFYCEPLHAEHTGTFVGLVEANSEINAGLGGHIRFTVTSSASLSGVLTSGTRKHPFTGVLQAHHHSATFEAVFPLPNRYPLGLWFEIQTDGRLTGYVQTSSRQSSHYANLDGGRIPYNRLNPAVGKSTKASFALTPLTFPDQSPQGSGVGTISLNPTTGSVTFSGRLADATTLTASSSLTMTGSSPLFRLLPRGSRTGSIFGWCRQPEEGQLAENPGLWWTKAPSTSSTERNYKQGFVALDLQWKASGYTRPVSPAIFMGLPPSPPNNAQLTFQHTTALPSPGPEIIFSIGSGNTLNLPSAGSLENPRSTTLKIDPATGIITGTFRADSLRTATFSGRVVGQSAYGYFLLPAAPGPGENPSSTPILSGGVQLSPYP